MGSIYRRKNSKFWWIKYSKRGKAFFESSGSEKRTVAEKILKLREGEIAQGKLPGVVFERVLFDELAEDFKTDYKVNEKDTLKKAERNVGYLVKAFGGMRATDITTAAIKQYIAKRMEDGMSNATINRELAALKRMFRLAIKCTPPKVALVPYIPMLKENNIRTGFFEDSMFEALLKELPEYIRPIATFGYITGWRKGEILNLTWRQIDFQDCTVRLEPGETKNGEGRTIYMEPELLSMLKDLFKKRRLGCPYVFHHEGEHISEFRKAWNSACMAAEIPGMLFHDLRRTAVRNMVRAGIPERVAMAISGHKTRAIFDRYDIVSMEDLKQAALKKARKSPPLQEWLHNGYIRHRRPRKVVRLKVATS